MGQAVSAMSSVLERERKAALAADVELLARIQDEKRLALSALHSDEASAEELDSLRGRAMANVQLIRHLTMCLQGMLAPPGATYTPGGARPSALPGRSWGRL